MATNVIIAALVLFLGVAMIFILAMFTHLRTLYRKLMERHAAVSLLLAAYVTHENDKKLFSRIGRLSKKDLPEFVEDFREKLKSNPDLAVCVPANDKEDAEFIIYLTLRILFKGMEKSDLTAELPELLYLSPSVKKSLGKLA